MRSARAPVAEPIIGAAITIKNADKARESGLEFDVIFVFMALFWSWFRVKVKTWCLAACRAGSLANDPCQGYTG
jgi:hypothetical protein